MCTYKRNCGRFFPRQQLISNPVVLSVKSIYTEPFSLVMVVWDGRCVARLRRHGIQTEHTVKLN